MIGQHLMQGSTSNMSPEYSRGPPPNGTGLLNSTPASASELPSTGRSVSLTWLSWEQMASVLHGDVSISNYARLCGMALAALTILLKKHCRRVRSG